MSERERKRSYIRGHEPLRVPQGWNEQDKQLIVQLERLFDNIFQRFGRLRRKDLGEELNTELDTYGQAAEDVTEIKAEIGDTALPTTAQTITGAIAEHETDISGINTKIGSTVLPTTAQTLTGAIAEHETDITGIGNKIGSTVLPTTAQTLTGAIAEHETDISGIGTKIGSTTLPTTAQTLTGAIAEVDGDIGSMASELSALYSLTVTQLKGK